MGAEQTDSWYLMDLKSTMDGLYGSGYYQELMALAYQENDGGFGEALALSLREFTPASPDMTTKDMLQLYTSCSVMRHSRSPAPPMCPPASGMVWI